MKWTSESKLMKWVDRYVDLVEANLINNEDPSDFQLETTKKAYEQLKELALKLENIARGPSDEEIVQLYDQLQERRSKRRLEPACSCDGWGCWNCCSSEQEIRGCQGTFG